LIVTLSAIFDFHPHLSPAPTRDEVGEEMGNKMRKEMRVPAAFDRRQARSFGLRLVPMLAGQLKRTVETGPGPGTELSLTFGMKAESLS
jgi:hypothetical protein